MERLILERKGRVLIATNNDPATRNSLNWDFYDGFREAVEATSGDAGIGAIVLTGAAGFFCSGGNVNALQERAQADYPTRRSSVDKLHAMILAMRACPKPIIAAVDGGAAGAGASVAAACDLVVAARDAYFSVAYVKIGLTPDGGATAFLGTALPRQLMAEMVFTGDRIPVERLYTLGLINRLTEPGQSLPTALEMATRLADGPAAALAVGKRLIDQARLNGLKEQLDYEADGIATALGGPEGREGIAAFLEKRKPDFRSLG
ncbi:MAG TPA: enoyl-CoA hydratase family protein [Thermohalobaculum sp.]|nr:enoyl-CoA hydratase family protein [Thermohalobaculum sp.]